MHTHMGGIHGGALTDIGLRRAVNEDAVLSARSIFAVADGMGGHEAGDLASRLCIETLAEIAVDPAAVGPSGLPHAQAVLAQVERADAMIRGAIGSRGGTTLCALALVSCEPGGGTWPQEKPAAATTLELPVQPDAAAAPEPGRVPAALPGDGPGGACAPRGRGVPPRCRWRRGARADHRRAALRARARRRNPRRDAAGCTGSGPRSPVRAPRSPGPAQDPEPGHEPAVRLMLLNVGDSRGYRLRGGS